MVKKNIDRATKKEHVDATKPLRFTINAGDIKRAKCGDPSHCVVAEALRGSVGDIFDAIYIGKSISKIVAGKRVVRYRTPEKIGKALPIFDKTGKWKLPLGDYSLTVPGCLALGARERPKRKTKKYPKSAKPSVRTRKVAAPTRKVLRVDMLCKV